MNVWKLRNFLIQQPPPSLIRMTCDGTVDELAPGKRSRVKLAESILAKGPDLVECLDKDGRLLRAIRPEDEGQTGRSAEAPPVPAVLQTDPETARVTHFANLLHRAYEHSTDIAFSKLVELVERMSERAEATDARLERVEAAYRREQSERIDDLYDRAEETAERAEENPQQRIIESLINGAVQGRAVPPAKTNGKGEPPS